MPDPLDRLLNDIREAGEKDDALCAIPGCYDPVVADGLCARHGGSEQEDERWV